MLPQFNMCRESIVASRQNRTGSGREFVLHKKHGTMRNMRALSLCWCGHCFFMSVLHITQDLGKCLLFFSSNTLWLIPFVFLLPRSALPQHINHLCGHVKFSLSFACQTYEFSALFLQYTVKALLPGKFWHWI